MIQLAGFLRLHVGEDELCGDLEELDEGVFVHY